MKWKIQTNSDDQRSLVRLSASLGRAVKLGDTELKITLSSSPYEFKSIGLDGFANAKSVRINSGTLTASSSPGCLVKDNTDFRTISRTDQGGGVSVSASATVGDYGAGLSVGGQTLQSATYAYSDVESISDFPHKISWKIRRHETISDGASANRSFVPVLGYLGMVKKREAWVHAEFDAGALEIVDSAGGRLGPLQRVVLMTMLRLKDGGRVHFWGSNELMIKVAYEEYA